MLDVENVIVQVCF